MAGELLHINVVAGDLALTYANTFAQKAMPIYDKANHIVLYPFM